MGARGLIGSFEKIPLEVPRSCVVGFMPKQIIITGHIFPLNTLKGKAKAFAVDLLRQNSLRGRKTALRPLKGMMGNLVVFYTYGSFHEIIISFFVMVVK